MCVFVGAMIRSVLSHCVWVCWCYDQECTLSHCGFVGAMIRSELSITVCVLGLLVL